MSLWIWLGFIALVLTLIALDLGVFNRTPRVISAREALGWTTFWVVLALAFSGLVYLGYERDWFTTDAGVAKTSGGEAAALFLTAYLLEKSLSLDNVFVIALVLSYFRIPREQQHRVLFWGVLGALVLRGLMIAAGTAAIQRFDFLNYVFGAILLATAIKMLAVRESAVNFEQSPLLRVLRRWVPLTSELQGQRFFTRVDGQMKATPLLLSLLLVEAMDVVFAVDSIPAVFSVTLDPFIAFTSNVLAILGLRSLYFALAAIMDRFQFLKASLVSVLAFIGLKMLVSHHAQISAGTSLTVVVAMLLTGVLASTIGNHPRFLEVKRLAAPVANARVAFAIIASVTVLAMTCSQMLLPRWDTFAAGAGFALLGLEFHLVRNWLLRHAQGA